MTGNEDSGNPDPNLNPSNRSKKGRFLEEQVRNNAFNKQFSLFKEDRGSGRHATELWVLLYHHDAIKKEVRYELSLPSEFQKKNITDWSHRIVVGKIAEISSPTLEITDIDRQFIDVPVEPKTGT
jgi:hypothetical protein